MDKMQADRLWKKAFQWLIHIVLSLMIIDWAVILPFSVGGIGVYEIAFALLGCTCLARLYYERGGVFRQIFQVLRSSPATVIFLVAYLAAGVVTLFYSPNLRYALTKYVVVVQMLFFGVCLCYYVASCSGGSKQAVVSLFGNLGISAAVCGLWGMADFFLRKGAAYPPVVSPITDYNQYTTILLVGFIAGVFAVIRLLEKPWKRYLSLGILLCTTLPPVAAGGSRRSLLLMMGLAVLLAVYLLADLLWRFVKTKNTRYLAVSLCGIFLCAVCTYGCATALTDTVSALAGQPKVPAADVTEPATEPSEEPTVAVTEPVQTQPATEPEEQTEPPETVPETEPPVQHTTSSLAQDRLKVNAGLGKRAIIWDAALEEIRQSDTKALLFGHGDGYETEMYDDLSKPLSDKVHRWYGYSVDNRAAKNWMNPHNVFLHDMLGGGLMLLSLQLAIILAAFISTIRIIRKDPLGGIVLGLLYGVLLITLLLSSGRGMLSNKFFWLFTVMQIAQRYVLREEAKKGA